MTDDEKINAILAAVSARPVAPTNQTPASNALEMIFRGLTGVCATGIAWLVITMPVMRENIKDLKADMARVEANTKDRYTNEDAARDYGALLEKISVLEARTNTFEERQRDGFERIQRLEVTND